MDADGLGEGFLGQATFQAVAPQVGAHGPLEVVFHSFHARDVLLVGLQTYK